MICRLQKYLKVPGIRQKLHRRKNEKGKKAQRGTRVVADLRKHHQKSILPEGVENSDIQKLYAWFARG